MSSPALLLLLLLCTHVVADMAAIYASSTIQQSSNVGVANTPLTGSLVSWEVDDPNSPSCSKFVECKSRTSGNCRSLLLSFDVSAIPANAVIDSVLVQYRRDGSGVSPRTLTAFTNTQALPIPFVTASGNLETFSSTAIPASVLLDSTFRVSVGGGSVATSGNVEVELQILCLIMTVTFTPPGGTTAATTTTITTRTTAPITTTSTSSTTTTTTTPTTTTTTRAPVGTTTSPSTTRPPGVTTSRSTARPTTTTTTTSTDGGDSDTTTDTDSIVDSDSASTARSTGKTLSLVDANRGSEAPADEGFPTWAIAVIVVVGMICLICVLYFVAFASLPPRETGDDKEMQELITELESKHPDVDFDALKAQIYAELPRDASAIQQTYGNLNAVEAQRIVDEAVKMHDTTSPRHSFLNPPFRGMFTRNYGKAPTAPRASSSSSGTVATSSYGGVTPSSSANNQYGIFPTSQIASGPASGGAYGGVPQNLDSSKPAPVPRPLPTMPASAPSQYGLLSARSPRD